MQNDFRVEKSGKGYRVALYRNGERYATFVDSLSLRAAQQEARSLTVLWQRIGSHATSPAVREMKQAS